MRHNHGKQLNIDFRTGAATVTQSVKMRDQLAVRSTEKDLKESGKLLSQTTEMERIRMMFPSERSVSSI